jgi:hypothetical protein
MASHDRIAEPFKRVARLMLQGDNQLVPFRRGDLHKQLEQQAAAKTGPTPPSLNLMTPGLPQILQLIPGAGAFFGDIEGILKNILTLNLPGLLDDAAKVLPDLIGFVGQQLGLGLSLIALFGEAVNGKDGITTAVHQGYQDYFFNNGFKTLEGGLIMPPSAGSTQSTESLSALGAEFRGLISRRTGDQYARDLIRIAGEATGDAFFHLKPRQDQLLRRTDAVGTQLQSWFKGFANLAESTVTSAVEEATQGVAAFSTNPLIAASLGTFAGVAARKATQDAALWEFGIGREVP